MANATGGAEDGNLEFAGSLASSWGWGQMAKGDIGTTSCGHGE